MLIGNKVQHNAAALRTALLGKKMVRFEAPQMDSIVPRVGHTIEEVRNLDKSIEIIWDNGIVLNTLENQALVIDASTDKLIHRIPVAAEPYQLTFTKGYAYVRGLASPRVSMINLGSLGQGRSPIVQGFDAGPAAPRRGPPQRR